jgi:ribosome biogenesis GTPase
MATSGRIVEQHKSVYHVDTGAQVVVAGLRGLLKRSHDKPCVGDVVDVAVGGTSDDVPVITRLHPRRNRLLRPVVANVDQALLLVSLREPPMERDTVDRFLLQMDHLALHVAILFNKTDLLDDDDAERLKRTMAAYTSAGYACVAFSAARGPLPARLHELCRGKVSTLAGASGVGKSTLLNALAPQLDQATAEVSRKTARGVHTTTTTSLLKVAPDTYVVDTPGFVALTLPAIAQWDLQLHFPELAPFVGACRFNNCQHIEEPGCVVRERSERGELDRERYQSYVRFHAEIAARPRRGR